MCIRDRLLACAFLVCVKDGRVGRTTTGTQTESAHSSDKYSSGRTTGRGPETSYPGSNAEPTSQVIRRVLSPAISATFVKCGCSAFYCEPKQIFTWYFTCIFVAEESVLLAHNTSCRGSTRSVFFELVIRQQSLQTNSFIFNFASQAIRSHA